ncbi:MAG: hypothetical protein IPL52_08025 [Flavobacteriales bacterium]|nr:hypothetical protein [Flavobacteriales bacterium]
MVLGQDNSCTLDDLIVTRQDEKAKEVKKQGLPAGIEGQEDGAVFVDAIRSTSGS